ncbi:MAG: DUF1330 domain-containing protein [Gammaproteobacteria bacterium]|nr:DUF1330 domain-containing protein [Gammaproteobacteria bacterium]
MNRSLVGFLAFLLVLVVAGLVGTWILGPNLVGLAIDEERRSAPYYLLNFAAGESALERSIYRSDLAELVVSDGGQLLWQAPTVRVVEGRVRDEWQHVQLFEFPRAGDFVEMFTSSSYRAIADAHPGVSLMLLGTSNAPAALAGGGAFVLSLMSLEADQAAIGATDRRLLGDLESYGGTMIWASEVEDLEDQWTWNRVLMLGFPTLELAEAWLRDPDTVTDRALAATVARRRVTLVLESQT